MNKYEKLEEKLDKILENQRLDKKYYDLLNRFNEIRHANEVLGRGHRDLYKRNLTLSNKLSLIKTELNDIEQADMTVNNLCTFIDRIRNIIQGDDNK